FRDPDDCPILKSDLLNTVEARYTRQLLQLPFYSKHYRFADDLYSKLYALGVERIINLLSTKRLYRFAMGSVPSVLIGGVAGIAAVVAPFYFFGLRSIGSIKYVFKSRTKNLADEINYKKLIPITISILSKDRIKRKAKLTFKNSIYAEHAVPMKEYPLKNGNYQYLFQLYYLEYLQQTKFSLSELPESISTHKTDSKFVKRLGLTLKDRIANPSIDSSLNNFSWRSRIELESRQIELQKIEIKGLDLGNIIDDINNKQFSLFYSLKNLNYHVNPILEYDLRDVGNQKKNSWYFKENTKAFYMEL
ncbi:MAG: hypothetical protein AAFZ89_13100, partial [Bacteroidota bacterium]